MGFLIFFLLLTLCSGPWLFVAPFGWLGLAFLCFRDIQKGVLAAVFFAAFFHRTGFFPDFFFSLKHFHLAVLVLGAVALFRKELISRMITGLEKGKLLYPAVAFLVVSFISAGLSGFDTRALLKSFNLSFVFLAAFFLLGFLVQDRALLKKAIGFFILGVALQCLANFHNLGAGDFVFELDLMYNNQFATLTALTLFYALAFCFANESWRELLIFGMLGLVILIALVVSCSRTGWLGFAVGLTIFTSVLGLKASAEKRKIYGRSALFFVVSSVLVMGLAMVFHEGIAQRFLYLRELVDWSVLFDKNPTDPKTGQALPYNFGFLGIDRLNQISDLKEILATHLWLGLGLIQRVTNYHGFFFTVLGGTGVLGLICFVFFLLNAFVKLVSVLKTEISGDALLFYAAAFSAFTVWVLSLIMQTMFVHFSIWMSAVFVAAIIEDASAGSAKAGPQSQS